MDSQTIGQEVPQDDLPSPSQAPTQDSTAVPDHDLPDNAAQAGQEVPDSDLPTDPDSLSETWKAGVEGLRQGVLGPIAALQDKYMPSTDDDSQAEATRAAEHPIAHGIGEAAGLITGPVGELAGAAGTAGATAADLGKIGSGAIKGAIESGLFQANDEISKGILGQGDPTDPVGAALSHIGAATLLGGGIGTVFGGAAAGLAKLGANKMGDNAGDFMNNFAQQWDHNVHNPDPVDAVTKELNNVYQSSLEDNSATWGSEGLKAQGLSSVIPEMSDAIKSQVQKATDTIQNKFMEMASSPDTYPTRLVDKFQNEALEYLNAVKTPDATPEQIFNATDKFKGWLQDYSKFDKQVGPLSPEKEFISAVKDLSHGLRTDLESTDVWGEAGQIQSDTNSKWRAYNTAQKDLVKGFTRKIGGVTTVDPGKVATYVNQAGKGSANAILKKDVLNNYLDASQAFRDHVSSLSDRLGLDHDAMKEWTTNIPVPALEQTMGQQSWGAKAANEFYHTGRHTIGKQLLGGAVGTAIGGPWGAAAGYALEPVIEDLSKKIGRKIIGPAVPAILKMMASANMRDIYPIMDYATQINKGQRKVADGIESLFKYGGRQALEADVSDKDREKIKKYIENGEFNRQVQAQKNKPMPAQTQKFAEGGEVQSQFDQPIPTDPATPVASGIDPISRSLPDHAMLLGAAKGRVSQYLNSLRPLPQGGQAAFDDAEVNPEQERSYNRAVDIAAQPLSILNNIKEGTLDPEDMNHFKSLYPEVYQYLSKKMTDRITKAQMDGEKPSYKVRQGMSLFLGTDLDSTLTQPNIMAAQAVFAQQNAQKAAAPTKPKKNTSKMGEIAKNYQTDTQASIARRNS